MDKMCYLLDLDGTIYRGNELIPEAKSFLEILSGASLNYKFITNNSSRTPEQLSKRLSDMGIDVNPDRFITTALATANYLATRFNNHQDSVFIIGEDGLYTAIRDIGFKITNEAPDIVVVGLDRSFNFDKLTWAVNGIKNGAVFIATNPDKQLLTEDGIIPGTGSIVAMVESETGIQPKYIGKPHHYIFEYSLHLLKTGKDTVMVIGDNYNTDIIGASQYGLRTALVLSGITKKEELTNITVYPDYIVESLDELAIAVGLIKHF
jgi:4-nitrophenyl phosphatase